LHTLRVGVTLPFCLLPFVLVSSDRPPFRLCYDGLLMKSFLSLLVVAPLALSSLSCKKAEAPKPVAAATTPAASTPPAVPGAPAVPKPMPPQIPDVLARVNGET